MSDKIQWELYIDESFNQKEEDGVNMADNVVIGGILIKTDKRDKIFKILKELKALKRYDGKKEIKGNKLKPKESIPFIEKLLILNEDCKVFYSNDVFSDKLKEPYTEEEVMKEDLTTPGNIFRYEYNKMVSFILQSLFKNKEYDSINVKVFLDQKAGLNSRDLSRAMSELHKKISKDLMFPFEEPVFVESSKHPGIQIADIIVNTFFKFHTKPKYRENNRKSFNAIKRSICYENVFGKRRKGN